jgi:hypothetical protein
VCAAHVCVVTGKCRGKEGSALSRGLAYALEAGVARSVAGAQNLAGGLGIGIRPRPTESL